MAFSSIHFIFVFLPIAITLYYLIPFRLWRYSVLIFVSLLFVGWVNPTYLPTLIIYVLINYSITLLISKLLNDQQLIAGRLVMVAAVIFNIGFLAFYKYLGFFSQTLESLAKLEIGIKQQLLPLGISYITFSSISYILDVYNKVQEPEKNLLRFGAYLIMFPKFVQGPITRLNDLVIEFGTTKLSLDNLTEGSRRFIIGLAKKVILADNLAIVATKVFDGDLTLIGADVAWYGLVAYTLQIFFDFSGYTDMAIGIGYMLGFKLPENFNFPYISRSVTDFWRRWHMSLTAWFRTYVFIPLEFTRKHSSFFRQQTNIFILFLLTGLWHGAGWNYVIWGAYFGLILGLEVGPFGKWIKRIPAFLQHFYAIMIIMIGWIFFRITSIPDWGLFFRALIGINGWVGFENLRSLNILRFFPLIILSILFSTPVFENVKQKLNQKIAFLQLVFDFVYIGIFLMTITYILTNGFTSFIYAQF